MYKIYFCNVDAGPNHTDNCPADSKTIDATVWGSRVETLVYNDLSAGYSYISKPKLTLKENEAGELTFDIYPEQAEAISANNWLSFMSTEIMVTKDDGTQDEYIIWCGRLVSRDRDMNGTLSCTCEGDLNYLYDIVLPPELWNWILMEDISPKYDNDPTPMGTYNKDYYYPIHLIRQYNYVTHYIGEVHNRDDSGTLKDVQIDHNCKYFHISDIPDKALDPVWTMSGGKKFDECNTVYERLQSFLEDTKAYVYIEYSDFISPCTKNTQHERRKYIRISSKRPGDIDNVRQSILFGRNLLDYADTIDMSSLHTFAYPIGAQVSEDSSELPIYAVASPYNPTKTNYVYKELTNLSYAIVRPYTYDTDDEEILYKKAKEYNDLQDTDLTSITIKCIDINYVDHTTSLDFMYPVRVISPVNNIDGVFYITSMNIDMSNPENNQITLNGYKIVAVTDLVAMTQDTDAIKRSVKYINGQVGNVGKVLDQIIDV